MFHRNTLCASINLRLPLLLSCHCITVSSKYTQWGSYYKQHATNDAICQKMIYVFNFLPTKWFPVLEQLCSAWPCWWKRSDGYSALGCWNWPAPRRYQPQITTMIKMLMIAIAVCRRWPVTTPVNLVLSARCASVIRNRLGWNASSCAALHCSGERWPRCMDCFAGVSCDVDQSMLKGGRQCWANKRRQRQSMRH